MPRTSRILDEDRTVALRLRSARVLAGFSQERLAEALGCSFQQIQKREAGTNRISIGALLRTAKVLGTTVDAIIDAEREVPKVRSAMIGHVRIFSGLSAKHQEAVCRYAKTLAGIDGEP